MRPVKFDNVLKRVITKFEHLYTSDVPYRDEIKIVVINVQPE